MSQKNTLLNESIPKIYAAYLVPTLLAMISSSIYVIADVLFVATCLGETSLAAFNICMPIYTCYSCISLLFGVGASTTISICNGRGDEKSANNAFSLSLVLVAAIALTSTILGITFIDSFSYALGATTDILPLVKEYIIPVHSLSVFYMLSLFFQIIIRGDYNPKLVMMAAVTGNMVNIGLDYHFMINMNMGLKGASIATGAGPVVSVSILMLHYIFKKNHIRFEKISFDIEMLLNVVKNGSGSFILEFTSGTVIFLFNFALLRISGSDAVAIYAIISNLAYITKSVFSGICQAAQPLISVNYGAKNFDRVKKSVSLSIRISIIIAVLAYASMILFPQSIMGIFIGNYEHLIPKASKILVLYFSSLVFTGLNTAMMYYFQSTGNAKLSSLMSLLRGFVFILLGLVIFAPILGETGVWFTILFAEGLTFFIAYPLKKRYDTYLIERFNPINDITSFMSDQ